MEETSNSIYVIDYNYFSGNVTATVGLQMDNTTADQFGDDLIGFATGGSSNSDNDYYEFYVPFANDLSVTSLSVPFYGFPGVPATIEANISNLGTNAQTGFDVTYMVDDGSTSTFNYSGTLNSGESVDMDTFGWLELTSEGQKVLDQILYSSSV